MAHRNRLPALTAVLLAAALCACRTVHGPRPEDVPEEVDFAAEAIPILQVTLRATDNGYSLVEARRAIGTPTLALGRGQDVLITARDANGEGILQFSVPDPRLGHTTGREAPRMIARDPAVLHLRLPYPDVIQTLEVRVRSGPNADLRESFVFEL